MELKEVKKKDLGQILKLVEKEFQNAKVQKIDLEEKIDNADFALYKIEEKDKITGFIETEFLSDEVARVNALVVEQKHREKGLGKELLKKMIEKLEAQGVRMISVLVRADNIKAKQLYSDLGFNYSESFEDYESNAIIEQMELELDGEQPSYIS